MGTRDTRHQVRGPLGFVKEQIAVVDFAGNVTGRTPAADTAAAQVRDIESACFERLKQALISRDIQPRATAHECHDERRAGLRRSESFPMHAADWPAEGAGRVSYRVEKGLWTAHVNMGA